VIRIEGEGNYSTIFTNTGLKIMCSKTLKSLEQDLLEDGFIRVHKSHLVNKKYITSSANNCISLTDNTLINVSVRKQSMVKKTINDL
jgi:two-component system LytT family response regulator